MRSHPSSVVRRDGDSGVSGGIDGELASLHPLRYGGHARRVAVAAPRCRQHVAQLFRLYVVSQDGNGGVGVLKAQELEELRLFGAEATLDGRFLV